MKSRSTVLALMALVLMHQLIAGVFAGGTVLCIGSSGGVALQPVGLTCCADPASHAANDPCCADDVPGNGDNCVVSIPVSGCEGCTDHELTSPPTLRPHAYDVALPTATPAVIVVIEWPVVSTGARNLDVRRTDRAPPPLSFLSTVILRC